MINDYRKIDVKCIGRGNPGDGCGYKGGISGGTCPECNGMLLSRKAIETAEKMEKIWEEQERTKNAG